MVKRIIIKIGDFNFKPGRDNGYAHNTVIVRLNRVLTTVKKIVNHMESIKLLLLNTAL